MPTPFFSQLFFWVWAVMSSSTGTKTWEAPTLGVFLRKIAIDYVRYGYVYHSGMKQIPEGKQLWRIDKKLLDVYQVSYSPSVKVLRKKKGIARVAYVRFGREFLLLSTNGEQTTGFKVFTRFPDRDFRVKPLVVHGYQIYLKGHTPVVEIETLRFARRARFIISQFAKPQNLVKALLDELSPFNFPGIVRQKRRVLERVNERRRRANLPQVQLDLSFGVKGETSAYAAYTRKRKKLKEKREKKRRTRNYHS